MLTNVSIIEFKCVYFYLVYCGDC